MIPYIVINGVSSKTINGLLIQSLPPITKPAIRTEIEEIDGRDGDIVTTLGYSAYDREILIGLRGDFNIDDIIEYFNQEGEIIFSNEPDKIYKFAIYSQIDFERLIRFRTATVTLHVQPFKTCTEPPIEWNNTESVTIADINVRNKGNIYSKPTFIIKGSGNINIYINNKWILELSLPTTTTAFIDAVNMNATNAVGDYINRQVTGDYSNLIIPVGINQVRVTGAMQKVTINNYSRWI